MARVLGEAREGQVSMRRVGGRNVIEGTISYVVESTSVAARRMDILATPGLPVSGVTRSLSMGICIGVDAVRREECPTVWDVEATFSSDVQEQTAAIDQSGNPIGWVPRAELNFERTELVFSSDIKGKKYTNSRKQPYMDGLMMPAIVSRMDFFQFEAPTLSYREIMDRCETVNKSRFLGIDAKKLYLSVNRATYGQFYTFPLWLIEYTLRYRPRRNWRFERLDYDLDGTPLDGNGAASNDFPGLVLFDIYEDIEFDFLRLTEIP